MSYSTNNYIHRIVFAVLFFLCILTISYKCLSAIHHPDIYVSIASQQISNTQDEEHWNLRGWGYNQAIKYGIYFTRHLQFNVFQREQIEVGAYYLLYIVIAAVLSLCFRKISDINGSGSLYFLSILIYLATNNIQVRLQAEEIAILLALLGSIFVLHKNYYVVFFSGLLVFPLFLLKGVTISYWSATFIALALFGNELKSRLVVVIISSVLFCTLSIVVTYVTIPLYFDNLLIASQLQSSGIDTAKILSLLSAHNILNLVQSIPAFFLLTPLILATCFILYRESFSRLVLYIVGFLPISLSILIQSGFPYHFTGLLVALPYSLIFLFEKSSLKLKTAFLLVMCVVPVFTAWLYSDFYFPRKAIFSNLQNSLNIRNFYREAAIIFEEYVENSADPILFLSSGTINYWLKNPSYLKYFYPLPLQRVIYNSNLRLSKIYLSQLERASSFDGKFIIHEKPWFSLEAISPMQLLISQKYYEVARVISHFDNNLELVLYKKREFSNPG
jgi:hypothetical protein